MKIYRLSVPMKILMMLLMTKNAGWLYWDAAACPLALSFTSNPYQSGPCVGLLSYVTYPVVLNGKIWTL